MPAEKPHPQSPPGTDSRKDGDSAFPLDPSLTALQAPVFWLPDAYARSLILVPLPEDLSGEDPDSPPPFPVRGVRHTANGEHLSLVAPSGRRFHVYKPAALAHDRPFAFLIPFDSASLERLDEASEFCRLAGQRVPRPAPGPTRQQARRFRHMLQAIDGYKAGASYRQIAQVIFGAARIKAEHWKTSALRDATLHLVRDGKKMIAGGYRKLLRRNRKN